jgi:hypothetical protein
MFNRLRDIEELKQTLMVELERKLTEDRQKNAESIFSILQEIRYLNEAGSNVSDIWLKSSDKSGFINIKSPADRKFRKLLIRVSGS